MYLARQNIFNLPDPHLYACYVERYQSNLHVLRLRLDRLPEALLPERNALEIVFTGTLYFNGVFNWIGGSVCVAEQSDFEARLFETDIIHPDSDAEELEETLETYHLFVIPTESGYPVQFIASSHDYALTVIR